MQDPPADTALTGPIPADGTIQLLCSVLTGYN